MSGVLELAQVSRENLAAALDTFGLRLQLVESGESIPGSYWGDSEAGLIKNDLYARLDTPVHSILHEACHYICMCPRRRNGLHTNAGGDYDEENAVCYLQILMADRIQGMDRDRMLLDMDNWGYSFRLGSARRWFEQDADQPRTTLAEWGIINASGEPNGLIRQ